MTAWCLPVTPQWCWPHIFLFPMIPTPVPINPGPFLVSCVLWLYKCASCRTDIIATLSSWSSQYFLRGGSLGHSRAMWPSYIYHLIFCFPHMGHMGLWWTLSLSDMAIPFGKIALFRHLYRYFFSFTYITFLLFLFMWMCCLYSSGSITAMSSARRPSSIMMTS